MRSSPERLPFNLWRAAEVVGPGWERRYGRRFAALAAGGPRLAWNSEAALTPLWGFRRRIPLLRLLVPLFPVIGVLVASRAGQVWGIAVPSVVFAIVHGAFGDWLYFREVSKALTAAEQASDPADRDRILQRARTGGAVPHAAGSAMLLLLGYGLFAFATSYHNAMNRAKEQSVRSALRTLVAAQQEYFADHEQYTAELATTQFVPVNGVRVRVLFADSSGFAAEGTADALPMRCEIFIGSAGGLRLATEEGTPTCGPTK